MKLCWIIPGDRSGGISPVAWSCCQQAAQAGHETTVLMLSTPTWMASQAVRVVSLELDSGAVEAPIQLLQWLDVNPQDVLVFNGCGELDAVIPYLPSTVRCIFVVHDTIFDYWRNALEREADLDAIVAVSETVASKLRHCLQQPQKLSVIYNGCAFPPRPELVVSRPNDLIFLGGNNPTKGAFDVLQVWKHLITLNFTGKLHWFGRVTEELSDRIRQLPRSEQICVYGAVPRDEIFVVAASSKVLLMLSRVEPFGMATIEAMSMGCVPVAWDVETGTKEITTANATALFAPLGDLPALAKQILYACEHHTTFSQAVVERARSAFDETVMWHGYASLVDQVSRQPLIERSRNGQQPAEYQPPVRRFQRIPPRLRSLIRSWIGRSPTLGYWLRDMRGW
jgi:glycosyltransferase involved in cell wall biosynthesis